MWSICEELHGNDAKATPGLMSEEDERNMGLGQVAQSIATLSVYFFKTKIQNKDPKLLGSDQSGWVGHWNRLHKITEKNVGFKYTKIKSKSMCAEVEP